MPPEMRMNKLRSISQSCSTPSSTVFSVDRYLLLAVCKCEHPLTQSCEVLRMCQQS